MVLKTLDSAEKKSVIKSIERNRADKKNLERKKGWNKKMATLKYNPNLTLKEKIEKWYSNRSEIFDYFCYNDISRSFKMKFNDLKEFKKEWFSSFPFVQYKVIKNEETGEDFIFVDIP